MWLNSPTLCPLGHLGPNVGEISWLSKTAPCIPQTRLLLFPHILDGGLQSICCFMKRNVAAVARLPPRFLQKKKKLCLCSWWFFESVPVNVDYSVVRILRGKYDKRMRKHISHSAALRRLLIYSSRWDCHARGWWLWLVSRRAWNRITSKHANHNLYFGTTTCQKNMVADFNLLRRAAGSSFCGCALLQRWFNLNLDSF